MIIKPIEFGKGKTIEGPTGSISITLEVSDSRGGVEIQKPGEGCADGQCRITGNTYNAKDDIKKLPYGDDGTQWNGEVWLVNKHKVAELTAVLMKAGYSLTIDGKAVSHCDDFGELREEVDLPGDEDGTVDVMYGPHGDNDEVSCSWAEDAADLGNYDDVETFADKFGLTIVEDEVIRERHNVTSGEPSEVDDLFTTEGV